jgi:hypothetical protein
MRVASRWAPDRPQRGPTPGGVRGRSGSSTTGPAEVPAPRLMKTMERVSGTR